MSCKKCFSQFFSFLFSAPSEVQFSGLAKKLKEFKAVLTSLDKHLLSEREETWEIIMSTSNNTKFDGLTKQS